MKYLYKEESVKRIYLMITGVLVLATVLSACGAGQSDSVPTYKINESTGLYSAFGDINAEQLATLPEGTVLVPADDETKLFCDSFTEEGMPFMLCKVKILETGQTGWVLKLYIEKN